MCDMTELKQKTLLTREEAAFYIGVSKNVMQQIMSSYGFTPLVRIGNGRGRVFVHREKLDQWIDEQDGSRKKLK